ncbi:hypothetical protein PEC302110_09870 [Pectobacterium araliae]|uniref:Uncharacterized protein n=1 Tax=Pectobacterium araliae TaxID=3073862 RepID=A0AAN0KB07_9GAMM|nr:hypothetical protein PEC302110_09870 [Pectobacterium sp. MAFF 302110]
MVAAENDKLAACALEFYHEAIIHFPCIAGGRTVIKNITCDYNGIDLMVFHLSDKPAQKSLMFSGAAFGIKVLP